MGKYLIILILCFPALSFGQGFAALGNTNPLDTARILNNYFLPMKAIRMPAYAPAVGDSNIIFTISGGRVYGYSLTSFLSRIGSYVGVPTLQQVLTSGSALTQNNTITFLTKNLTWRGQSGDWKTDSLRVFGRLEMQDGKITYLVEPTTYDPLDVATVKYVTQSSFDTTMSTTVTALTSSRFSRVVSGVNYSGLLYNSNYFTQIGTTLTFVGLTFFNGQKLTIYLR